MNQVLDIERFSPPAQALAPEVELTVLMPCLNEAETVQACVAKALGFLRRAGVKGEVLVADNGSTDGSQALAEVAGARVVGVLDKGYGAALMGGIRAARGRFVIMGDADDSYDFERLDEMLAGLRGGAQLIMGNRFRGGIAKGAMPPLHRYLGNPVLSFLGRLFFKIPVGDFHCGLRGFSREAILALGLKSPGMEFASEMVVKAALRELVIAETPTPTTNPTRATRRIASRFRPRRNGRSVLGGGRKPSTMAYRRARAPNSTSCTPIRMPKQEAIRVWMSSSSAGVRRTDPRESKPTPATPITISRAPG